MYNQPVSEKWILLSESVSTFFVHYQKIKTTWLAQYRL